MTNRPATPILDRVHLPADMKALSDRELKLLADELRAETISAVSVTGGHLGAGLGVAVGVFGAGAAAEDVACLAACGGAEGHGGKEQGGDTCAEAVEAGQRLEGTEIVA